MSFFPSVGPLTYLIPGETQYWQYGWGDEPDHGLNVAGPTLTETDPLAASSSRSIKENNGNSLRWRI